MKLLLAIVIATTSITAIADDWTGADKTKHAIVGAVIGAAVTASTESAWRGCLAASGVGLAKELYDSQHQGTASAKDFLVTAAAGCFAARGTAIYLSRDKIVFTWSY